MEGGIDKFFLFLFYFIFSLVSYMHKVGLESMSSSFILLLQVKEALFELGLIGLERGYVAQVLLIEITSSKFLHKLGLSLLTTEVEV